jgi:threonine synthase
LAVPISGLTYEARSAGLAATSGDTAVAAIKAAANNLEDRNTGVWRMTIG